MKKINSYNKRFNLLKDIIKSYNTASKYVKQKLTELKRNRSIYMVIMGNFKTHLSEIDKFDFLNQDRYRRFHLFF